MNATFFLLPLAAVLMLMMPLLPIYKGITTGKRPSTLLSLTSAPSSGWPP